VKVKVKVKKRTNDGINESDEADEMPARKGKRSERRRSETVVREK
jgi:hypothetical protein